VNLHATPPKFTIKKDIFYITAPFQLRQPDKHVSTYYVTPSYTMNHTLFSTSLTANIFTGSEPTIRLTPPMRRKQK